MQPFTALILSSLLSDALCKSTWRYNLTVTTLWDDKDGHGRPRYALNGQSPGPLLTVREGDELEVFVDNQLAIETTMHWHGVYQIDHPWNDGVPGVTQFSIQPRDNYTYRMTIEQQYGSYFYHGHFGPAFADGMRGPIWIIPAEARERPYKLISNASDVLTAMKKAEDNPRHIIISDWNAEPMDILLVQYRDTGFAPWCSNSLTMNDKGRTYCHSADALERAGGPDRNTMGCLYKSPQYQFTNPIVCEETFTNLEVVAAEEGESWIWINFIHSGAHHEMSISIDEHDFYVVAADGEFVHPQKVQRAHANLGERISILVPLDNDPKDYAIRLNSLRTEQVIEELGILRYPGAESAKLDVMKVPDTKPFVYLNGTLISAHSHSMDELQLKPYPPQQPPQTSDTTLHFQVTMTGPSSWVLNSSPHQGFRQQIPPLLWHDSSRGDTSYGSRGEIRNGSVVDIILTNDQNVESMHPFHKHNNKAWIIGQGYGGFPFSSVAEALEHPGYREKFNLVDPPRRDGCRLEKGAGAWVAIRYDVAFPAASMMHCHMIHHFASGQQVILLEGIEAMEPVPDEVRNKVHADFVPPVRYGPLD